jgi:hypothetical protein
MDIEFRNLSYTVKPRTWNRKGMLLSVFHTHPMSQVVREKCTQFPNRSFVFCLNSFNENADVIKNLKA